MKPQRMRLANELVLSYGLHRKMDMFHSRAASASEMSVYHSQDYIQFLQKVAPTYGGTVGNFDLVY